jgi:hypothetical protein
VCVKDSAISVILDQQKPKKGKRVDSKDLPNCLLTNEENHCYLHSVGKILLPYIQLSGNLIVTDNTIQDHILNCLQVITLSSLARKFKTLNFPELMIYLQGMIKLEMQDTQTYKFALEYFLKGMKPYQNGE